MNLHLGHGVDSLRPTFHNGPGWRIPLWLQGCSLRCTTRCLNPRLLPAPQGAGVPVSAALGRLEELAGGALRPVEGITVLGGEPSDQPQALADLLRGAWDLGLSTMVYTGHRFEQLAEVPGSTGWLSATDLLVDGPYLDHEYDDHIAWRGSRNQRLLRLSDRYSENQLMEAFERQGKGWSIQVRADGGVSMSGLQSREGAMNAEDALRRERR